MELDKYDQALLDGEYGESRQKMMEILLALGKIYDAERFIPVKSVQVSGASFKTIGEAGLGKGMMLAPDDPQLPAMQMGAIQQSGYPGTHRFIHILGNMILRLIDIVGFHFRQ